jgi:hypothetical protein
MNPRLMRPLARFQAPSPAFSPLQLTGLRLWLDAATSSSMTLNSGNVSEWSDLSPEGNDATQATAMNQPAYVANSANGLGSVVFDGSNDFLDVQISGLAGQGEHCVGWVFARLGGGTGDGYSPTISVLTNNASDYGALHYIKNNLQAASYPYYAGSGTPYDGFGQYGTDELYVTTFRKTAGTGFSVFTDGAQEATGATVSVAVGSQASGFRLAAQESPFRRSNIRLCEVVLLFNPIAGEAEKLEGYLAHRWGLQAKLPSGHPYKGAAP